MKMLVGLLGRLMKYLMFCVDIYCPFLWCNLIDKSLCMHVILQLIRQKFVIQKFVCSYFAVNHKSKRLSSSCPELCIEDYCSFNCTSYSLHNCLKTTGRPFLAGPDGLRFSILSLAYFAVIMTSFRVSAKNNIKTRP